MNDRPPAAHKAGELEMPGDTKPITEPKSRARKAPSAFRTISEVADELNVPQHVLRFWEGKFTQIKPLKRGGGRRYYRPDDIALLRQIASLLYVQGYTIKGVQRLLREGGGRLADNIPPPTPEEKATAERLEAERYELLDLDEPQLPMPGLTPRMPPPSAARKPTAGERAAKPPNPARPRRSAKVEAAESVAESMGVELVRLQRVLRETLRELEQLREALR